MIAIILGILLGFAQLICFVLKFLFHPVSLNRVWIAPLLIVVGILEIFTQLKISIIVIVIIFIIALVDTVYNILN